MQFAAVMSRPVVLELYAMTVILSRSRELQ